MLLTITTTHPPATDLGFLLEKHPGKIHEFELPAGKAVVFYPQASDARCTVALLLSIDPVGLVRSSGAKPAGAAPDQYVNDRPYVLSSFMSVALGTVFRSALAGKSRQRADLAATPIPLEVCLPVLACRGGGRFLHQLFDPLGYTVDATQELLDDRLPGWGTSPYCSLRLTITARLQDVLRHLYVLIPVLDDYKHYWVGEAEVEKLLRHATEWLPGHPMKEWIVQRYLKHRRSLAQEALAQLTLEESPQIVPDADLDSPVTADAGEAALEARVSLGDRRIARVGELIASLGITSVADLGCGEGRLLAHLLTHRALESIVGMDVSLSSLARAEARLHLDRMPPRDRARIQLLHGSLVYRDERLKGFGAACLLEVIEHLDPPRLAALERALFEHARPTFVLLTTPNREYNIRFASLPAGHLRHADHRFEWTRAEFSEWCTRQCGRFGYQVEHHPIGDVDAELGPPTQLALFSLKTPA